MARIRLINEHNQEHWVNPEDVRELLPLPLPRVPDRVKLVWQNGDGQLFNTGYRVLTGGTVKRSRLHYKAGTNWE